MKGKPFSINFKLNVSNAVISTFPSSLMLVLFPWIVLTITGSALLTGAILSLSDIPLAVSFIVGYYLTTVKKKKPLSLMAQSLRPVVILSVLLVFLTGNKFYELISIFLAFFLEAWINDIVEQIGTFWHKEFLDDGQYQRGSSLSSFFNMGAMLIAYIAAGVIIYIGVDNAFLVLVAGYAVATIPLIFVKPQSDKMQNIPRHSFGDGFSFVWKIKEIRYLVIYVLLISLTFGGALMMIEVLVKVRYGGLPFILTLFLVGSMTGGVLGSIWGGKIKGNARNLLFPVTVALIFIVIFIPLSPSYIYLVPDLFFMGVINQIQNVLISTFFYTIVPQDYTLQVRSVHRTVALFPAALSALIFGAIIQFISLPAGFYIEALVLVPTALLVLVVKEFKGMKITS